MSKQKQLVIAMTGASGSVYGLRTLMFIPPDFIIHLVISDVAKKVIRMETGWDGDHSSLAGYLKEQYGYNDQLAEIKQYRESDHFASIASGSFQIAGVVIIPSSVKTMAEIANGIAANLISRAADVTLKERGRLILVVRETPLNLIHLENMTKITKAGGIILPASPAFYQKPESVIDLVDFIVGRVLNLLNIEHKLLKPWGTK